MNSIRKVIRLKIKMVCVLKQTTIYLFIYWAPTMCQLQVIFTLLSFWDRIHGRC